MWFIPMCIGNTNWIANSLFCMAVYPCVYREHILCKSVFLLIDGLSLCIQGTQKIGGAAIARHRFIPVYTGNTIFTQIRYAWSAVYPCVYREHAITK